LFIGGQISSLNIFKLRENNIKRVLKVNGIENFMAFKDHGIDAKILAIDDLSDFDIEPFLVEAHSYINDGFFKNEGVLVVCTAGISRSATIVISFLMKYKKMNYEEAYQTVKRARVFIKPNNGFEKFLRSYEAKLNTCELCLLKPVTE
jgi:protein-tyrosine phosphatase